MRVLFTPMNERWVLGVCDTTTGKVDMIPTPLVIDDHRPFGLTWSRSQNKLFLSQPTSVWEFDLELNFKRVIAEKLWYGLHQITAIGRQLCAVSPRINGIVRMDFEGMNKSYFTGTGWAAKLPDSFSGRDRLTYSEDKCHYNSILLHKSDIYLTAHNHGPSFIEVYDREMKLKRVINGTGSQCHNVLVDDGVWWVDSMGRRGVVNEDGRSVKVGGDENFVRGLAGTPDYFFTTKFNYSTNRLSRRMGDAEMIVIDRRNLKVVNKIKLPGVGNVNDVRLMDVSDLGHNVAPMTKLAIF